MTEAFREVLNVVLAELLNRRGSVTIPERIRSISTGQSLNQRMPDVTIANYQGVRIVIEGRSGGGKLQVCLQVLLLPYLNLI